MKDVLQVLSADAYFCLYQKAVLEFYDEHNGKCVVVVDPLGWLFAQLPLAKFA